MENLNLVLYNYLNRLNPISTEDFEKLTPYIFVKELRAKEKLTEEGQIEENIYFVVRGILRKYFRQGKEEHTTLFFRESEICNSAVSFYTGTPSPYIIEAIEPSVCIGLHRRDWEVVLMQLPSMSKGCRTALAHLCIRKDMEALNRAMKSKKELFLEFCEKYPDLLQRVPQKYLASYLQIAPETFCRMKHVRYNMARSGRQVEMNDAA